MTIAKDIESYSKLQEVSESTGNPKFANDVKTVIDYAEKYQQCVDIANEIGDDTLKNYIQRRWKVAKKENIR